MNEIKFRKYFCSGPEGVRVKCWYSTGADAKGRYVEVVASEYCGHLRFLPNLHNDTDTQTDYFEKDRAYIYEIESPALYRLALEAAIQNGRNEAVGPVKPVNLDHVPGKHMAYIISKNDDGKYDSTVYANGTNCKQEKQLVNNVATMPKNVVPFVDRDKGNQLVAKQPIGIGDPVRVWRGRVVIDAVFSGYASTPTDDLGLCWLDDADSRFVALRSNIYGINETERLLEDIEHARVVLRGQYTTYAEKKETDHE